MSDTVPEQEQPWQAKRRENRVLVAMSRDEFDRMMCGRFPAIFADRNKPMSETCMCWGFDVGPGWRPILLDLCAKIEVLCRLSGCRVVASQVKEKYATLHFYFHAVLPTAATPDGVGAPADALAINDIFHDVVNQAEDVSSRTCEECGKDGSLRIVYGWHSTLCDDHAKERCAKFGVEFKPTEDDDPKPSLGSDQPAQAGPGKDVRPSSVK